MIEISFRTIMLSSPTVLIQTREKQSWFLQVKGWGLCFVCYRETTNKPLLLGRPLCKSSALRATLSWELTWKRQNIQGKDSLGKLTAAQKQNKLDPSNRVLLNLLKWLADKSRNFYGLTQTASGNYFWDMEKQEEIEPRLLLDHTEIWLCIHK